MNHYETLGVEPGDDDKAIKAAFLKKSKTSHPDKGGSTEAQTALSVAFNAVKTLVKREAYDRGEANEPKSKVDKHETYIIAVFENLIATDFKGNIIKETRARLVTLSTQNQGLSSEQAQQRRALTAKLGRVKTKGDVENFYEALLTQKIAACTANIKRCDEEVATVTLALKAMSNYEDTMPDAPPPGPPSYMTGHDIMGGGYPE